MSLFGDTVTTPPADPSTTPATAPSTTTIVPGPDWHRDHSGFHRSVWGWGEPVPYPVYYPYNSYSYPELDTQHVLEIAAIGLGVSILAGLIVGGIRR